MKFIKWLASTIFTVWITIATMVILEMSASGKTAAIHTCFSNALKEHEDITGQRLQLSDYEIISVSGTSAAKTQVHLFDIDFKIPNVLCIMPDKYTVSSITTM